jgi:hypothetical protein
MPERFQEDALLQRKVGQDISLGKEREGRVRTTTSLGVVRAECDWNRDEYGIFRFGEDAYGRACVMTCF